MTDLHTNTNTNASGLPPDTEESTEVERDWREPILLDGPPPPGFPLEVLPAGLRSWVEAVATAYQVPADLPARLALGCISAAAAGRARVRVAPDWTEQLCAYIACVLPSGERKSPVVQEAVSPLEWWEREALERDRDRLVPRPRPTANTRQPHAEPAACIQP